MYSLNLYSQRKLQKIISSVLNVPCKYMKHLPTIRTKEVHDKRIKFNQSYNEYVVGVCRDFPNGILGSI